MSRRRSAPQRQNVFGRFVSYVVLICVLLVVSFGVFWLLGESLFPLKIDQNVVFINPSSDGTSSEIIISHFSVTDRRIELVPLSGEQMVEVMGGYGKYQLGKVYPLLKLDKKNDQYLRSALSWAMGVVIDKVVIVTKPLTDLTPSRLTAVLRDQLIQQGLHPQRLGQLAELYFFAKTVPLEQVSAHPMVRELPKLAETLHQTAHQECSIAIVNTTGVAKLASRLSTIVEQSGQRVVRIDDLVTPTDASQANFDPANLVCRVAAGHIAVAFTQPLKELNQPEGRQESRADLVITIGKDLGNLFVP